VITENRVKALKDVEVDVALALLGLTSCADTIIGNENLKGVSGGERRRVTLGEMLVTGSQILCCNEISTGRLRDTYPGIRDTSRDTKPCLGDTRWRS